jgi:riboflavin transporter FmnP
MHVGTPMRRPLSKLITLTASLLLAATAQILAFMMTGAGHGWLAPFLFSLLLWVAYPAVGFLLLWKDKAEVRSFARAAVWLLGAAILADILLMLMNDWAHLPWFLRNYPGLVVAWAALWIGWQIPSAWLLSKRVAGQP